MLSGKKVFSKVLIGALALSMITSTGITAMGVSAKLSDTVSSISEKASGFKAWLTGVINEKFSKEQAKEMLAKLSDKIVVAIPDEVKEKVSETVTSLMRAKVPKEMIQQFVSEFVDYTYKCFRAAGQKLSDAYAKLPDDYKEKISDALNKINEVTSRIREKTDKYKVYGSTLMLTEGDYTYRIKLSIKHGVEAVVCNYNGTDTKISVPSSADGIPVTEADLLSDAKVTAVTLPETIENVNALSVFGMPYLKYLYVKKNNPNFKSKNGIVFDKSGKTLVAVPQARKYSPSEGITAIGDYAFAASSCKELTIPSSVTRIGKGAFLSMWKLSEITIPDGVTEIGPSTFTACISLKKIVVPSSVTAIARDAFLGIHDDAVFYCSSGDDAAAKLLTKMGYNVSAPLSADFDATALALLGGKATFTVNARYGSGDNLYYFYIRRKGATSWKALQVGKPENSFTYAANSLGDYQVCMKVKDSSGKIIKKYTDLTVIQTANNLSRISTENAVTGETVTVNCKAIDIFSKFAVYYKESSDSKWVTVQKYSRNRNVDLTFDAPGTYEICVKAKDLVGFVSKKYFTVTVE